jgi:hypothetical protein
MSPAVWIPLVVLGGIGLILAAVLWWGDYADKRDDAKLEAARQEWSDFVTGKVRADVERRPAKDDQA